MHPELYPFQPVCRASINDYFHKYVNYFWINWLWQLLATISQSAKAKKQLSRWKKLLKQWINSENSCQLIFLVLIYQGGQNLPLCPSLWCKEKHMPQTPKKKTTTLMFKCFIPFLLPPLKPFRLITQKKKWLTWIKCCTLEHTQKSFHLTKPLSEW